MDINNRAQIIILVDRFYDTVKTDEMLGPVFHAVIGNNWDTHLEKMYNFWESLLLHEPVYHGKPYPKHADLPVQEAHFERWLQLFRKTIDNHFEGPQAERAYEIADNVARVFMARMFSAAPHLNLI